MNHTLYFNDEQLVQSFCRSGKNVHGSISKAMSEAMQLWLQQHQGWSTTFHTLPHQTEAVGFEDARQNMHFTQKDVW